MNFNSFVNTTPVTSNLARTLLQLRDLNEMASRVTGFSAHHSSPAAFNAHLLNASSVPVQVPVTIDDAADIL